MQPLSQTLELKVNLKVTTAQVFHLVATLQKGYVNICVKCR